MIDRLAFYLTFFLAKVRVCRGQRAGKLAIVFPWGPRKLASAIAFGFVGPESWRARYRVAVRRWLANKLAVHAEEDGNSVISVWRGVVQGSIPDTLLETNVDPETEKRETGVYVYL